MQHYTIETGHCRETARHEVADHVVALMAPLLAPGEHTMPHPFERYRLRVTVDGGTLVATVYSGSTPLVTTFVCTDIDGIKATLKATGAIPRVGVYAPIVLVETHPTLGTDRGAIGWLGDFERCLGWAWVERSGG